MNKVIGNYIRQGINPRKSKAITIKEAAEKHYQEWRVVEGIIGVPIKDKVHCKGDFIAGAKSQIIRIQELEKENQKLNLQLLTCQGEIDRLHELNKKP